MSWIVLCWLCEQLLVSCHHAASVAIERCQYVHMDTFPVVISDFLIRVCLCFPVCVSRWCLSRIAILIIHESYVASCNCFNSTWWTTIPLLTYCNCILTCMYLIVSFMAARRKSQVAYYQFKLLVIVFVLVMMHHCHKSLQRIESLVWLPGFMPHNTLSAK